MDDFKQTLVKVELVSKSRIRKACEDCPFRLGSCTNETLAHDRIADIIKDSLNDKPFIRLLARIPQPQGMMRA